MVKDRGGQVLAQVIHRYLSGGGRKVEAKCIVEDLQAVSSK